MFLFCWFEFNFRVLDFFKLLFKLGFVNFVHKNLSSLAQLGRQ
nr:MAG TPA: Polyphosphate kinase N-terminal domain [Caudoviricetes sp.]